jgi:hypothetical protein
MKRPFPLEQKNGQKHKNTTEAGFPHWSKLQHRAPLETRRASATLEKPLTRESLFYP